MHTELGSEIVKRTYWEMLPGKFESKEATVMLLAIGLQESRFVYRKQVGGPAVGFWQFEQEGGVRGVLEHPATRLYALAACTQRGVQPTKEGVYLILPHDDLLACEFARLLLYSDPKYLPSLGHAADSWDYYIRNWRPGKPHRDTWDQLYTAAMEAANSSTPF